MPGISTTVSNHHTQFRVNETDLAVIATVVLQKKLGRDLNSTVVKEWSYTPRFSWTTVDLTLHRDYLHLRSTRRRCCCTAVTAPEVDEYCCLLKNTSFIETGVK